MGNISKEDRSQGKSHQLLQEKLSPKMASTTDDRSKEKTMDKKKTFRHEEAAWKFLNEKFRAVEQAKKLVSTSWYMIDDHVFETAKEDPSKHLDQVHVMVTETIDDLQHHHHIFKMSSVPKRPEPDTTTIVFEEKSEEEKKHKSAQKELAKMMYRRDNPTKRTRRHKNRSKIIKMVVCAKEVVEWSWSDDVSEEDSWEVSWEDLGFEKNHVEISWEEQCRVEQKSPVKGSSCYKPSRLRMSLTVREE